MANHEIGIAFLDVVGRILHIRWMCKPIRTLSSSKTISVKARSAGSPANADAGVRDL